MAERNRAHLKQEFRDGERPTGGDFADLMDSFVCKVDDQVHLDANNNLDIPGGVNLKAPATGVAGTLRFNAGSVQVFDGATWVNVGGSAGAFLPVAGGPSVAFGAGNVGIGAFAAAPTFRLEVDLGVNAAPADRVKFGNAVISNGAGLSASSAQFAQTDNSAGNTNFALRQAPTGEVLLNSPLAQRITLTQGGNTPRLLVMPTTGQVVVAGNTTLPGATAAHMLQVTGDAAKSVNGNLWTVLSDGRYKKDIAEFQDGLDKLMHVRPVKFKYDGLPGIPATDKEEVGIIGQELKEVFPYMISGGVINDEEKADKKDDVLMYNGNALTYVMVNAIQELANRVKELEGLLESSQRSAVRYQEHSVASNPGSTIGG